MITDKEILEAKIESWKVTIDTQMHFNEMAMKIRHFGFILLAAVLGAAGFSLRSDQELSFSVYSISITLPVASLLIFFGALIWFFIMFLDTKWYSPFLVASVKAGLKIETEINQMIGGGFYLTSQIKEDSGNITLFGKKLDSKKRSRIFHWGMIGILIISGTLVALTGHLVTKPIQLPDL